MVCVSEDLGVALNGHCGHVFMKREHAAFLNKARLRASRVVGGGGLSGLVIVGGA